MLQYHLVSALQMSSFCESFLEGPCKFCSIVAGIFYRKLKSPILLLSLLLCMKTFSTNFAVTFLDEFYRWLISILNLLRLFCQNLLVMEENIVMACSTFTNWFYELVSDDIFNKLQKLFDVRYHSYDVIANLPVPRCKCKIFSVRVEGSTFS